MTCWMLHARSHWTHSVKSSFLLVLAAAGLERAGAGWSGLEEAYESCRGPSRVTAFALRPARQS